MGDDRLTVRSVERALDILLCFREAKSLTLSEIATATGLHKSTVHRLLTSLQNKQFLTRDSSSEKYRLGFSVWELASNYWQSDDAAIVLLPEMERMRDLLGETISLYVRDGHERIRIQSVQSNQSIRRVAPVGVRLPLHVGASSKVLLAFASEEERRQIFANPEWPQNIDLERYEQQLAEVRNRGYATSIEEREPGVAAVAAPVFNRFRDMMFALSVSGPVSRLTQDKLDEYAEEILKSAKRMGNMLK